MRVPWTCSFAFSVGRRTLLSNTCRVFVLALAHAYRLRKKIGIISRITFRRDVRHGTDAWVTVHTRTSSGWYVVSRVDGGVVHMWFLQGQTDDPVWAWARRHTFHSWREHYKNYSQLMDARIDYYLGRYKNVGHHLGHDPRRHNHRELRQEEEEEEEEDDEEQQGLERQDRERREQVLPGAAAARRARDHLARHEQDLETFDEEDGGGVEQEEVAIREVQRVKRHGKHPRDVQQTQTKRARVSERSSNKGRASGVEASRSENRPVRESNSETEESQEIEGSDLFGDREFGDSQEYVLVSSNDTRLDELNLGVDSVDFPMQFSPRASSVPEHDGAPLSTQATLVASPLAAEKEHIPVPSPTPTKVVVAQPSIVRPTVLPNSEQRVVVNRERVVVQRAHVRGASAQPGPSVPREKRIRGDVEAVNAPHRNTRARSRSADPQPQPKPESQVLRRENRGSKGKAKAKEVVVVPIEEDVDLEEEPRETYAEEDVEPVVVTGGLSMRETFEDEMVVEGLLEASVGSGADEDEGSEDGEHDEDDEDGDDLPELPRFQVIEIESEPTDSDDAETHGSLVRGVVREGSAGGGVAAEGGEQDDRDDSSDDADADRIARMANVSLHAVPAAAPLQPRVTRARSKAATQTQTQMQSQTQRQTRAQTRLGNQAHAGAPSTTFPSPGTKARAVVDRFKEEEKRAPYAPPAGSRAARAVRKGGRR